MRRPRRCWSWLALLAVLIYGLSPGVLTATASAAEPIGCKTDTHSCACKPAPTAKKACCCKGKGESRCRASRAPCDSGADAAQAFSSARSPMEKPAAVSPAWRPLETVERGFPLDDALRTTLGAILTPPPRA